MPSRDRGAPGARSLPGLVAPLFPLALVLAVVLVYWNALSAPFHFDDFYRIVQNDSIRALWPPTGFGNRPVLGFSLALNHAVSGLEPGAYRATNIALHAASALLLYGIVRRTLRAPRFAERFGQTSSGTAFAVALLWALHPLHTSAVTYVWQRSESMMGAFFLATIYCTIRLAEDRNRRRWGVAAALAFLLGLGTKEVMVAVAPTLILYDGLLLAPSIRAALRRRWGLYAFMGAVLVIGASVILLHTETSAGKVGRWRYALSEAGVLLEYLRLTLWPHPISFDYGRAPAHGFSATVLPALAVAMLLAATVWALFKRWWWGVAGAWFFLVLAPTSSVVPINDLMVAYRMYLPAAAIVACLVAVGLEACRRKGIAPWIPLAVAATALGVLTTRGNLVYRSNLALWRSVVETSPENPRGHDLYGVWLAKEGSYELAAEHGRRSVELDPESANARWNLGTTMGHLGQLEAALEQYRESLRIDGFQARRFAQTAELMVQMGLVEEAVPTFRRAIDLAPGDIESHVGLAEALALSDRPREALVACRAALALEPANGEVLRTWAQLALVAGERDEAIAALERLGVVDTRDAAPYLDLGMLYIEGGDRAGALRSLEIAMRRDAGVIRSLSARARAITTSSTEPRDRELGLAVCELAVERSGRRDPEVLADLARTLALTGQVERALATFDELLALPDLAQQHERREAYELERDTIRYNR